MITQCNTIRCFVLRILRTSLLESDALFIGTMKSETGRRSFATRAAANTRGTYRAGSNPQARLPCMALADGLPEKAPFGKACHAGDGAEDYRRQRGRVAQNKRGLFCMMPMYADFYGISLLFWTVL